MAITAFRIVVIVVSAVIVQVALTALVIQLWARWAGRSTSGGVQPSVPEHLNAALLSVRWRLAKWTATPAGDVAGPAPAGGLVATEIDLVGRATTASHPGTRSHPDAKGSPPDPQQPGGSGRL